MTELCGYRATADDYANEHECELEKGHGGEHVATVSWPTSSFDLCEVDHDGQHDWGNWKPWKPFAWVKSVDQRLRTPEDFVPITIDRPLINISRDYLLDPTPIFPPTRGHWVKEPTQVRSCRRCCHSENDGEWAVDPASDTYLVYGRDSFTPKEPLPNNP